ncbi:hypothetical protein HS088_TW09G01450 [Tripterygium wilfordii]|uniref:Uncharacterized protein n=1 Tax=Tripterygium wilfordii TaxID=458696 RepID=A0A7J7DAJ4_TRIWF|nr:hypothetical protein HS088_TW09G01450 [Tripterygium wilfordii]
MRAASTHFLGVAFDYCSIPCGSCNSSFAFVLNFWVFIFQASIQIFEIDGHVFVSQVDLCMLSSPSSFLCSTLSFKLIPPIILFTRINSTYKAGVANLAMVESVVDQQAYVQEEESSRLKLSQLDQQLQRGHK